MKTKRTLRPLLLAACIAAGGFSSLAQEISVAPKKAKTRVVRSNNSASSSSSSSSSSNSNGKNKVNVHSDSSANGSASAGGSASGAARSDKNGKKTRIYRSTTSSSSGQPQTRTIVQTGAKKIDTSIASRDVTYIGVVANDLLPIVRDQLGISEGTGLAVEFVSEDGPAAKAGIRKNDILIRLDDQILVNPEQFRVLVRSKKGGDEVDVSLRRRGQQRAIKVKLGQTTIHERSGASANAAPNDPLGYNSMFNQAARQYQDAINYPSQHKPGTVIKLPDGTTHNWQWIQRVNPSQNGFRSRIINYQQNVSTLSDSSGTYTLTVKDGKRHLTALGPDGQTLFNGPVDTREQRDKAPKSVLKKVEALESPQDIKLRGVDVNLDEFINHAPPPAPPSSN